MPNCLFCYADAGDAPYHSSCSQKFFEIALVPELVLNNAIVQELVHENLNKRMAVTGVQPKLLVTIRETKEKSYLSTPEVQSEYILKPPHHYFPVMPETEDLTMHLAALFEIPVCEHALVRATDGSLVYIAKRFDREHDKKIHIEDFCQLSGLLTENKYKSSYEEAGKLVLKYCTYKEQDALKFFELVLFCFLTGNNDMHLKNFSLVHKHDAIILSPAYDLLNVNLVNPCDDEELALTLNGKKKGISKSDFLNFGSALQLAEEDMELSFKKFASKNNEVTGVIERSFLGEDKKEIYKTIWLKKQEILFQ